MYLFQVEGLAVLGVHQLVDLIEYKLLLVILQAMVALLVPGLAPILEVAFPQEFQHYREVLT